MHARTRTDVDDMVRAGDGFFVMLYNDYSIAQIAKVEEGI